MILHGHGREAVRIIHTSMTFDLDLDDASA